MMIEVKDRIPTYPGRVRMTPVAGQADTYDMVRADEPIEVGTPINKSLFDAFSNSMDAMRQRLDDKLFELTQRVRIGDVSDGTVFGLYENGVLVPFVKVSNNYSSSGRVLVVRKSCIIEDAIMNDGETHYGGSRADSWLNNQYPENLDAATRAQLGDIPLFVETPSGSGYIQRKVFLLSKGEYSMDYFDSAERRIATLKGTPVKHWTRTNSGTGSGMWSYVTETGDFAVMARKAIAGIRPAFTLPVDTEVTVGVPSTANTMATAEVI